MSLKDPNEYSSSWQWTKDHSQYHFDWKQVDQSGQWYQDLGRFEGDWAQEVQALSQRTTVKTWANRGYLGMLEQEHNDLRDIGAPIDLALTDRTWGSWGPTLTNMIRYFELERCDAQFHCQRPGQMFNLHIDKLYKIKPEDPDSVIRILVFLSDWEPGHFFVYGTSVLSHWRAGDVHTYKWRDLPHASANAGRSPRPLLMITGCMTDKSRQKLAMASADSIYQI